MLEVKIKILDKRIGNKIPLPKYITEGSSGLDLSVCTSKPIFLESNDTILLPTGISIYIQNRNYTAGIFPRSGLGHKNGIVLGNLVGIIDSDYQGEIKISCWNRGKQTFKINPGDRIAQLIFFPIKKVKFKIVNNFINSKRGKKGFGHSGIL